MKRIFVNSENRLRSGYRVLIQFIAWFILLTITANILALAETNRDVLLYGLGGAAYLVGGLLLAWLAGRWLDRRQVADFGFRLDREWWLDLGIGFLLGALLLSAVFVVELVAGWLQVGSTFQTSFEGAWILSGVASLVVFVSIAFNEEIVFRAYPLKNLSEGLLSKNRSRVGLLVLLVLYSMFFSLIHMGNPGANWIGWVNIVLAGMLLGMCYLVTGQLALSIGLHTAWNFFENFVFGYSANGVAPSAWLLGSQVNGPETLTGGLFGPDGGLLLTFLLGGVAFLVVGWLKIRGRWNGIRPYLAETFQNKLGGDTAPAPPDKAWNTVGE